MSSTLGFLCQKNIDPYGVAQLWGSNRILPSIIRGKGMVFPFELGRHRSHYVLLKKPFRPSKAILSFLYLNALVKQEQ